MTLARSTPLVARRTAPRRDPQGPTCRRTIMGNRCRRAPRYLDLCKSHAIELADDLFSRFVRARDRICQECGRRPPLQCAHLQPRTKFATRWDPLNAVALCFDDHLRFTANPDEWTAWCEARLGADAWELLELQANVGGMPDLAQVIPDLRRLLRGVT